jgi:hypothetical protein
MTINDYYNSKEAFYLKDFNKTIFPSMKTEDLYKVKISISKLIKIEISIEQYKKAINLLKEYSSPFDHSKVIIEKLKKEIIALEDERKIYETEIKDFKKHLKEQEETEKQTINTNNATNTVQNKANTTKIEKKPIAGSKSISQKSEEYVKLVELRRKIDKILLSITINDVYSYARKEGKYPKDVTSEDEKRIRKIIFNQRMSEITSYGYNYDEVISKYNQTANNIDSIKSIPVLFEKCKQELRIKGLSDEDMNKLQDDGIFTILENEFKLALEDKLKSDDLSNDLEAEIYYYLEKYTNVRKELSSFSDIETRKHLTESVKAKYFENTVLAPEISKTKSSGKGR